MSPQEVRIGMQVRVGERHRIEERRGKFGRVVGRYGGEDYVAVDVLFLCCSCAVPEQGVSVVLAW